MALVPGITATLTYPPLAPVLPRVPPPPPPPPAPLTQLRTVPSSLVSTAVLAAAPKLAARTTPPLSPTPPSGPLPLSQRSPALQQQVESGGLAPDVEQGRTLQAPAPEPAAPPKIGLAGENWFFVRNSAEYGGYHPDFGMLHDLQMIGVALAANDPYINEGAAADRGGGFELGVWADPHNYSSVDAYIADLKRAQQQIGAVAVFLDVETTAKGEPGSPEYNLSQEIAAKAAAAFPGIKIAVTPVRSGNDFDFKAYTVLGISVVVQTYGTNPLTDLFDPVEVVQLVLAQGVPADHVSVLLSPAQLPDAIPALHGIGIYHISVYTSDGLTPEAIARSAPFLAGASTAAAAPEATTTTTTTPAAPDTEPAQPPPPQVTGLIASPPPGAIVNTPSTTPGAPPDVNALYMDEVETDAPELETTVILAADVDEYPWDVDEDVATDEPDTDYSDDTTGEVAPLPEPVEGSAYIVDDQGNIVAPPPPPSHGAF